MEPNLRLTSLNKKIFYFVLRIDNRQILPQIDQQVVFIHPVVEQRKLLNKIILYFFNCHIIYLGKHAFHFFNTISKSINFIFSIIETEGSPHRSINSKTIHYRLRTMSSGSDSYTHFIQNHTCVILVYIFNMKRNSRNLLFGIPVYY